MYRCSGVYVNFKHETQPPKKRGLTQPIIGSVPPRLLVARLDAMLESTPFFASNLKISNRQLNWSQTPSTSPLLLSALVTSHCTHFLKTSSFFLPGLSQSLLPSNSYSYTFSVNFSLLIPSTCPNHFKTYWSIPSLVFSVSSLLRPTSSFNGCSSWLHSVNSVSTWFQQHQTRVSH